MQGKILLDEIILYVNLFFNLILDEQNNSICITATKNQLYSCTISCQNKEKVLYLN